MPIKSARILAREEIAMRLERLAERDKKCRIFGSSTHRYKLNPPLSPKAIGRIEKSHGMTLPEAYRRFLLEIGNGGAGPFYGLFKLGTHDDEFDHCTWKQGGLIGDLSKPFPHSKAWDLPKSFWKNAPNFAENVAPEEEQDRVYDEWMAKLEEHYWHGKFINGAIPICHEGCAYRLWLVLKGREAGHIWQDRRAGEAGISPLKNKGYPRLSFTRWYLNWLEDCERKLRLADWAKKHSPSTKATKQPLKSKSAKPSMMVLFSKKFFEERFPEVRVGDQVRLRSYEGRPRALMPLSGGGTLFIATVRPPEEQLWLVGELKNPKLGADGWVSSRWSKIPITDITELRNRIRFNTGKGISATSGKLAMSLQTPRALSDDDVILLRWAIKERSGIKGKAR